MVRKIVILTAIVCLCLALPSQALAYSSYTDGNMSTTYIDYFEDIVDGLPPNYNYVATRSGQYEYILHASDTLRYDSNKFISDDGKTYRITVGSGYNSQYSYNILNEHNFSLNTNGQMVYSSIGEYPRLDERGSIYEFSLIVITCIVGICALIRPIFKYMLRIR